eukprot:PhM_4_TR15266/c1_g1_i2/m.55832
MATIEVEPALSEAELRVVFGTVATVQKLKVTQKVAYLQFDDLSFALDAIQKFNGVPWKGTPLRVGMSAARDIFSSQAVDAPPPKPIPKQIQVPSSQPAPPSTTTNPVKKDTKTTAVDPPPRPSKRSRSPHPRPEHSDHRKKDDHRDDRRRDDHRRRSSRDGSRRRKDDDKGRSKSDRDRRRSRSRNEKRRSRSRDEKRRDDRRRSRSPRRDKKEKTEKETVVVKPKAPPVVVAKPVAEASSKSTAPGTVVTAPANPLVHESGVITVTQLPTLQGTPMLSYLEIFSLFGNFGDVDFVKILTTPAAQIASIQYRVKEDAVRASKVDLRLFNHDVRITLSRQASIMIDERTENFTRWVDWVRMKPFSQTACATLHVSGDRFEKQRFESFFIPMLFSQFGTVTNVVMLNASNLQAQVQFAHSDSAIACMMALHQHILDHPDVEKRGVRFGVAFSQKAQSDGCSTEPLPDVILSHLGGLVRGHFENGWVRRPTLREVKK